MGAHGCAYAPAAAPPRVPIFSTLVSGPFHTYLFYPQSVPFLFFPPGLSIWYPWQLTPRSRHSMDLYENYTIYLNLRMDGLVLLRLRGGRRRQRIGLVAAPPSLPPRFPIFSTLV